ncbi:MAG: acyl-CoA synthetase [Solirubrobacteraceae bacterium]
MSVQRIPESFLVPPELRAQLVYALPELQYGDRLNLCEELVGRRVAAGQSDRIAYHTAEGTVTYGALYGRANRIAAALAKLGVEPGDRVILRLEDSETLVATLLALWRIGAVAVPTFMKLRGRDLVYREQDTQARALIVADSLAADVVTVEGEFRHVEQIIAAPEASHAGHHSLAALERDAPAAVEAQPTLTGDLAAIFYTSGSTGEPKGCYHTHGELLSVPDAYGRYALNVRSDDVFAGPPPLGFALGFQYHVLLPLRFGASAVLGVPKKPLDYLEALGRYGVTVLVGVPTFYNQMLNATENVGAAWTGDSVRCVKSGGEPLLQATFDRWNEWAGVPLTNLIGFTEVMHHCISYREEVGWPRSTALGRALPGWEVVVRDPDSFREVPRGASGMLTVRGPTGTTYWGKPERQSEAVREGWNCFRDAVTMDDEGFLRFKARRDDVIVASGYNVAPAEVEGVLVRHPAVEECAVVGDADPEGVRPTIIKAFVVVATGADPGPELVAELQAFFKRSAPPHLYPRTITFVEELPTTSTGKLLRSALR